MRLTRLARIVLGLVACIALGAGITWYCFGTVEPCGVLRVVVRERADMAGGLLTLAARHASDKLVDEFLQAQIGTLTPRACMRALVSDEPWHVGRRPRGLPDPPKPAAGNERPPEKPDGRTQRAEAASKRAFDDCIASIGAVNGDGGAVAKCRAAAIAAWQGTGTPLPFAHGCTDPAYKVDHLGRCI